MLRRPRIDGFPAGRVLRRYCRAPVRPNLIALSLCKIVSVKGNVVEVEKIDAFEGTPILDLKPYTPAQDSASEVKVPKWAGPPGGPK